MTSQHLQRAAHRWEYQRVLFAVVLLCFSGSLAASEQLPTAPVPVEPGFHDCIYHDDAGEHRYSLFVPRNPNREPRPVVLFLHGAGEKGIDGRRPVTVGFGPALERFPEFPAFVVFPQCEDLDGRHLLGWRADRADAQRAIRILDQVLDEYPIDRSQQALCGWSMGGFGAWSLTLANPQRWSRSLILAGGGAPDHAKSLHPKLPPIWQIHGATDSLVPTDRATEMFTASGGPSSQHRLDVLPGIGHDIWRWALGNEQVMRWLITDEPLPSQIDLLATEPLPPKGSVELAGPFQPHVVIPQSAALRLGNDALRELAAGIPAAVSPEALRGELAPIQREIDFQGQTYEIELDNASYSTALVGCDLHAISGERFGVRFWLKDLKLTFDESRLLGDRLLAQAGPFTVHIGHLQPVTVSLEVRPEARDGRVQFVLLRRQLEIPNENWFIDPPRQIQSFDADLPERYIETGLVGGLYQRRHDIEDQVLQVIPALLDELSLYLEQRSTGEFANKLWPLPVLAPESRLQPTRIRTDGRGLGVELQLAAAFADRPPVDQPQTLPALTPSLATLGKGEKLKVQVAWDVIERLSAQYAQLGTAHVHVLDLPVAEFQQFAEPTFAARLLPEGTDLDEVNVLLQLNSPMTLRPIGAATATEATLVLAAEQVQIRYLRQDPTDNEQPLAQLTVALRQPIHVTWQRVAERGLDVQLDWSSESEVRLVDSTVQSPDTAEDCRQHFAKAWSAWTESQTGLPLQIPDLAVGNHGLHPGQPGVNADYLEIPFLPGGVSGLSDRRGK
ncbi:MAG: hypothetical protein KDA58_05910 [Planctomycetaceae bacterium]|nr:hypothetical protein [Planctomycetaceae bacterium]